MKFDYSRGGLGLNIKNLDYISFELSLMIKVVSLALNHFDSFTTKGSVITFVFPLCDLVVTKK